MDSMKRGADDGRRIDYSSVTPATGTDPDDKGLPATLANQMPTSDTTAISGSRRSDPDKIIPGAEAVSGVDAAEEAHGKKNRG